MFIQKNTPYLAKELLENLQSVKENHNILYDEYAA